jgi:hypothetical protein
MKKAIVEKTVVTVGPFEQGGSIFSGWIIRQVENNILFPVGEPFHFWVDCPDETTTDEWFYDFDNQIVKKKPVPSVLPVDPIKKACFPWLYKD